MKIRSLILAAFALLLLLGTLYWSEHRKPAEENTKASPDTPPAILKLDQAGITKVEFRGKNAPPIVLTKNSSGAWQITEPKQLKADQGTVANTLSTLSSLSSERVVDDKASDLRQYGLDQPALEVDITEKDNKSQRLMVGDDTPAGSAVYAMLAGDPRVFTLASYHKTSLEKGVNDLRDKRLLTISADKVTRLELIRTHQTLEFRRNQDEWEIFKPRPLRADSGEVRELVGKLSDARMDLTGLEKDLQKAEAAFLRATPVAIAKLTDLSGTQELQIRKSNDAYYARSNVVDGTYKIEPSLGPALGKAQDEFRNKRLFDFGFEDPTKIEMHNGAKSYFLSRSGTDWWSNGKKMDPESVQGLVAKLRELAASKFAESGFSNPSIELTVTSDDGKRIERVFIAKSGDSYVAKRENEAATLYQLEANSVEPLEQAAEQIQPSTAPSK
jgi:hypothetical protein